MTGKKELPFRGHSEDRTIYRMLISILLELLFTYGINSLNQMIINRFSQEAIAATTAVGTFLSLMLGLYSVFYVGQGILLAPCWGRKEYEQGSRIWTVSLLDNFLLSLLLGAFSVLESGFILKMMHIPVELQKISGGYLTVCLGFSLFQGSALTFASAFRAVGRMKTVMVGNILISVSCVSMNFLILILVPSEKQNIYLYAFAGILAQVIGCLFYFWMAFLDERIVLRLSYGRLREGFDKMTCKIFRLGILGGMEGVIYLISQTVVMSMVGILGTRSLMVKGYTANWINFMVLPATAVPLMASTIIGMNIGRRDEERVQRYYRKSMCISVIATLGMSLVTLLFGKTFLRLYTTDPEVLSECMVILKMDIVLELFRSVAALVIICLKAIGEVRVPFLMVIAGMMLNVGGSWFFGIYLGMGLAGIWIGYWLDLLMRGIVGCCVWKSHVKHHSYPLWNCQNDYL